MAKQSTIFIKGTIGNVVFYQLGDQYVARSRPAVVKQTGNMKRRSENFGVAAAAGKSLRAQLLPLLPFPHDKKMQSRFSGAIARWLGTKEVSEMAPQPDIPELYQFNFNENSRFSERCKPVMECDLSAVGQVKIVIPALVPSRDLKAPAHTASVTLSVMVATCPLTRGVSPMLETFQLSMDYNDDLHAAQELIFPVPTQPGLLMTVAASLCFRLKNGNEETRAEFLPAAVIKAGLW